MKYKPKFKFYPHQRRALKFLLRNRGGGLQVPMRWGKTKVAIDFANCMHDLEGVKRVLVICPLSVIGVWHEQIELHTPDSHKWVLQWMVMNYEQTYERVNTGGRSWSPVNNRTITAFAPDLVIVDESHRIGNPSTLSNKHAYSIGRKARFRLIMTGTMFHRKPFFVFGQAKFYDPGIFGGQYTNFRKRIAVFGGFGGFEVIRYRNLKWMMDQMKPWVYIEKKIPPGTPPVIRQLYFNLTGKGLKDYVQMEKHSVLRLENGEVVMSPIILSKHLRCAMIAGGWVKSEGTYHRVGRDKLEHGIDQFQSYADADIKQVVVGCRFLPEIADAAYAAKRAGYRVVTLRGGMSAEARTRARERFRTATVPIAMVCQISAGKEGIDLSTADTMLFWSLCESYTDYDQFSQRIVKYGETRTLQYDYLIASGTRDEVNYEAIKLKKDVTEFMISDPGAVERITRKVRTRPML